MEKPQYQELVLKTKAFEHLKEDAKNGISHAYLFVCPDDLFMNDFLKMSEALLYCEEKDACLDCVECRKVLNHNNPDIFELNMGQKQIGVKDLEEFLEDVDIKSFSGQKLYVIYHAEKMSGIVQNKLLKTLEEPPTGTTFILSASKEYSILQTIQSRCRKIYVDALDANLINDYLQQKGVPQKSAQIASMCCAGFIGQAEKLASDEKFNNLFDETLQVLVNLNRSIDILAISNSETIQENLDEFLDILSILFRDLMVAKDNKDLIYSKHIEDVVIELSKKYSARAIAEIILLINDTKKKLVTNVNHVAVLDSFLFAVLEARYKWQ